MALLTGKTGAPPPLAVPDETGFETEMVTTEGGLEAGTTVSNAAPFRCTT